MDNNILQFVDAVALAEMLSVKPRLVRQWARAGRIPSVRLSPRIVRFDPDEVEKALREPATAKVLA